MMNEEELLKEINRLKAENDALKESVLINGAMENAPKSLEEYFSGRYLETFRRVRKIRLENVKHEIEELNEKKSNFD